MKKLLIASLLVQLVSFMVFFYNSDASIISLTPVTDGHYYSIYDSCGYCPDAPFCELLDCDLFETEIGNEIIIYWSPIKAPGYGSERSRGILEFNISDLTNNYDPGQMQANLFLKAKEGDCELSLYNIDDVYEDGIIDENDVETEDLLEEVFTPSFPERTIVFDVTNALGLDLYEPNQTEFSGFVLKGCDYGYMEFYDHTHPDYSPRLCIRNSNLSNDLDGDCILDDVDNCPFIFNPFQDESDGDCIGDVCDPFPDNYDQTQGDSDSDGLGNICDNCPNDYNPNQEDTYPPEGNGIGDECECEGDFDCDQDQDGSDAATFKQEFGRSSYDDRCTEDNACTGNFDNDQDVDGMDAAKFKEDFGRSIYHEVCPLCAVMP